MQIAANNNLFFTSCSSFKQLAELNMTANHGAFYQQIALEIIKGCNSAQLLDGFAKELVTVAEKAYLLRQKSIIKQASQLLLNFDKQYQSIALYYQALSTKREGGLDEARSILERVAEAGPPVYRAKAMLSLGAISFDTGDIQSALQFYAETIRANAKNKQFNIMTLAQTQWMAAVIKSMDGDHAATLNDLIKLKPMILAISTQYPTFYYDYLNSLAVELGEVGRFDEAFRASRVAVASPYAPAYPEWRETLTELMDKSRHSSRSTIAVSQIMSSTENVVNLPTPQQSGGGLAKYQAPIPRQARVLCFQDYMKPVKEPRYVIEDKAGLQENAGFKEARLESLRQLSTRQKLLRIMDLMSDDNITDDQLLSVLMILEGVEADSIS